MFEGFKSLWIIPAEWTYLGTDILLEPQSRKILHAADYLVDQELDVVVGELLSLDDVVQVSPHQVGHLG